MHPPQPWCACLIKGCAITYLMHINRITKHARSIQEYSNAITIDLLDSFDIQKCGNHREKTIFTNTLNASFNFFFHNLLRLNSRWSGRIYGGGNTKWRNYECTLFTLEARIRRSIYIKLTFQMFLNIFKHVDTIYFGGENSKKYIFKIDLTFKLCKILLNISTQLTKEARIWKSTYMYMYKDDLLLHISFKYIKLRKYLKRAHKY